MNGPTDVTACAAFSLNAVVRSVDYQLFKFKLTLPTSGKVLCEFNGTVKSEAYSNGSTYGCRIPKGRQTDGTMSVRVLAADSLPCSGELKLKMIDEIQILSARIKSDVLQVEFKSLSAELTL